METLVRKVALEGIRFFAFHGYYPEEQLTGSEFVVNVETTMPVSAVTDELADTVNYERLFAIVSAHMKQPHKLIETVAHLILMDIKAEFNGLQHISVAIRKMHPPLNGEVKSSLVAFTFNK